MHSHAVADRRVDGPARVDGGHRERRDQPPLGSSRRGELLHDAPSDGLVGIVIGLLGVVLDLDVHPHAGARVERLGEAGHARRADRPSVVSTISRPSGRWASWCTTRAPSTRAADVELHGVGAHLARRAGTPPRCSPCSARGTTVGDDLRSSGSRAALIVTRVPAMLRTPWLSRATSRTRAGNVTEICCWPLVNTARLHTVRSPCRWVPTRRPPPARECHHNLHFPHWSRPCPSLRPASRSRMRTTAGAITRSVVTPIPICSSRSAPRARRWSRSTRAKEVCDECPAATTASSSPSRPTRTPGIWGGTSEEERRAMRRRDTSPARRPPPPPERSPPRRRACGRPVGPHVTGRRRRVDRAGSQVDDGAVARAHVAGRRARSPRARPSASSIVPAELRRHQRPHDRQAEPGRLVRARTPGSSPPPSLMTRMRSTLARRWSQLAPRRRRRALPSGKP